MATVTIGANTYDILDTKANVTSYLAASVTDQAAGYAAASADNQSKAIVTATRALQRESWTSTNGVATAIASADSDNIPQPIKDALAELSAYYANGDTDSLESSSTESTQKRIRAGSVEIENFRRVGSGARGYRFPLPVFSLIKAYLSSSSDNADLAISNGTSGLSSFSDGYEIDEGL